MKKYFVYLLIYSFLGFVLEKIINFIAYGIYYDNSVLMGPFQPLYGSGVLMAILFYDFVIEKKIVKPLYKTIALLITAIVATAISEAVTGYGFEYLYGIALWDYRTFLPCQIGYVCVIPTTLFGILSFFAIKYIHPYIIRFVKTLPNYFIYLLFTLFIMDIIITFSSL